MTGPSTIRLGVTGHRFLHDLPQLEKAIHEVLRHIHLQYPYCKLEMYNPLAPGADQLAASIALQKGIALTVILPFEQGQYLKEFPGKEREVFLQLVQEAHKVIPMPFEKGEPGYQALGQYLVERMDYLLAIWNGQPARGPGGTAEVVEGFRRAGKPLAWVRADNMLPEGPVLLPHGLEHGSIEYENG